MPETLPRHPPYGDTSEKDNPNYTGVRAMLAPKYMIVMRNVLSTLMLVPQGDRVPGLADWRHKPAR